MTRESITLGEVLFSGHWNTVVSESDWVETVQSIAAGNQSALHALFERCHELVFALASRIAGEASTAEEVTLEVFWDLWRSARTYDPAAGSVLGWIMNRTRAKALEQRARPRNSRGADRASVQQRLADRLAEETGGRPALPAMPRWHEPQWKQVAPGISCKFLATDTRKHGVSMLVRLDPGTHYPAHTHAGSEELHLLEGELWIDDRKLDPGDYYSAPPGTGDQRVWSETGCMCVLMTSTKDVLR
jgi:anti-sigma factor ChrR (cupin superfamily)